MILKRYRLLFRIVAVGLLCLVLGSCGTLGYYTQSVVGHSKMMLARKPITEVLETVTGDERRRLQMTLDIRRFAVERLFLPDNDSYSQYVELDREYPVWSVVAADEFSLRPKQWCYPVIGCASYRGYFSHGAAEEYEQGLLEKGFETTLGGVSAYSTLGWFDDPLTSAMLRYDDAFLVEILFHELAHQQLYVNGNSKFNEAFATVVGEQGAVLWLQYNQPELLEKYQRRLQVRYDFFVLIQGVKEKLKPIYASSLSASDKRKQKTQVILSLEQAYKDLKQQQWQGVGWYDGWFMEPVNNARLASIATYRDLVPAFERLFELCSGDYARFYGAVATQKKKGKAATVPEKC